MLAHSLFLTIVFSCAFAIIQRPLPTPSRVPLDQDTTIYIGTGQVITNGPVLSANIYISNMLWQDKCNELGGITVNGTNYRVAVVFVDLGDASRPLNDAEVVAKITSTWTEFINISGTYGRIDFSVTPFSTTYAIPALVVAEPAKMFTVSGILLVFFRFISVFTLFTILGGAVSKSVYTCQPISPTNLSLPDDCIAAGKKVFFL